MSEVVSGTRKRGVRVRSVLRWLLRGLSGLLALCAFLYLWAFWQCWHLEPTGDPLFDRFACAVRDRWAWRLYGPWIAQSDRRSLLPEATVVQWEDEYGADPRYWQLRYSCRRCDAWAIENWNAQHIASPSRSTPPNPVWEPLQQSADNGTADANTYLLLYEAQLGDQPSSKTRQQRTSDLLPLLEDAYELNPELAWTCYLRAMSSLGNGDEELQRDDVLHWLNTGKAATDDTIPCPFPLSFVEQYILDFKRPAGNRVLDGLLLTQEPVRSYMNIKALSKAVGNSLEQSGDLPLLQAYMAFLCRIGSSQQSGARDFLVVANLLGPISDKLAMSLPSKLTPEQLSDVEQLLADIRARCLNCVVVTHDEHCRYVYRFSTCIHLIDVLSKYDSVKEGLVWYNGLAPAYQQYSFLCDMRIAEQTGMLRRLREKFKRLADFDYINLRQPTATKHSVPERP